MTKILCTADNHLGYRQYGLQVREQDIYDSFDSIIQIACRENVDAITISGDLIHTTRPSSVTIAFLKQCQNRLMAAGIPALVIAGNHDNNKPHWLNTLCTSNDWDGDNAFGGFKLLENETYEVGGMKIFGAPFTNKNNWEHTKTLIPEDTDMLLMHQSFQEFIQFETDDAFTEEDIRGLARCVIVGDIHVSLGVGNRIYSPGSSELMSSSEEPQKYVLMVDDEVGDLLNCHFVELPTRHVIDCDITSEACAEAFFEELRESSSKAPLVFVKCDHKLSGIIERVRALYEDTMIIRAKYYNPDIEVAVTKDTNISLEEILAKFVKQDDPIYELAKKLLDADCDARFEIDSYIEKKLVIDE
jgi:DNA repair protein SbcD/Mre11